MVGFSIGIFLATFIAAIFTTRFYRLILWYGLNSAVLGLLAILIGIRVGDDPLIISGIITICLKALFIPYMLKFLSKKFNIQRDIESSVKVHYNIMLIPALIVFTFYLSEPFSSIFEGNSNYIAIAIASLFLSFILMIEHNSIAPKIVGFLMLENSLFLLGATATEGMPMLIELGVFFDLMVAIVIVNLLFKDEVAK